MPRSGFSGSFRSPKIDVVIDMGNPFLNRTVDGFLKIGAVGACKVAAEETFECLHRGAFVRPPARLFPVPFIRIQFQSCCCIQEPLLDGGKSFDFAVLTCMSLQRMILPKNVWSPQSLRLCK
jgi:hypothetical protein